MLQNRGKYSFRVSNRANKAQIKSAVETVFNVNVVNVNVMTTPSKTKRIGAKRINTPSWKKAIVTLGPGNKIDLFESV